MKSFYTDSPPGYITNYQVIATTGYETLAFINGTSVITNCKAWHGVVQLYVPGFCLRCGNREADPGTGYCDSCLDVDHKRWVEEDGGEL